MKKQYFYVFDEHTDYVRECTKIGMIPLSNEEFVEYFEYDGAKYKVLSINECFSGWTITYCELLNLMFNSRPYDEIVGSIGIILKSHLDEFILYLKTEHPKKRRLHKIKKLIKNEISERNSNVQQMFDLLSLCQKNGSWNYEFIYM